MSQLVIENRLHASAEKIWSALTQAQEMKQWFFETLETFEPRVGFETTFAVDTGERIFTHQWRVLTVKPQQMLRLDWSYAEVPGQGVVEFELVDLADACLVRIINHGLETFPQDMVEFQEESCRGGWTYFLQQLAAYVEA